MRLSIRAYNKFKEYLGRFSIPFAQKCNDYKWVESFTMMSIENAFRLTGEEYPYRYDIVLYNKGCHRKILVGVAYNEGDWLNPNFKFKFDHDEMRKRFTGTDTYGWGTKYIYETDKISSFKGKVVR